MFNVLIVDDDKLAAVGLSNTIKWSDYDMQVIGLAANGKKALDIISQQHVDLAFVDIGMPVMNGMELMRQCRRDYPNVQFVVLSFHEDFDYVQEALRLGVIDYISKEQTELDDYEGIMARIAAHMQAGSADEGRDTEEVRKLRELLEGVLWIYDGLQFEDVLTSADNCRHSLRAAERAVAAELAQTYTVTQVPYEDTEAVSDVQELKEILTAARQNLRNEMLKKQDSSYSRMMLAAKNVWDNYSTSLNSKTVAESVGLSRSHFSILFQKTVGMQFNVFLRRERVRNAMRLMRETELPQSRISESVGYMDIKNYNAAFQSVTGYSPGEYRSSLKEILKKISYEQKQNVPGGCI